MFENNTIDQLSTHTQSAKITSVFFVYNYIYIYIYTCRECSVYCYNDDTTVFVCLVACHMGVGSIL